MGDSIREDSEVPAPLEVLLYQDVAPHIPDITSHPALQQDHLSTVTCMWNSEKRGEGFCSAVRHQLTGNQPAVSPLLSQWLLFETALNSQCRSTALESGQKNQLQSCMWPFWERMYNRRGAHPASAYPMSIKIYEEQRYAIYPAEKKRKFAGSLS